MACFWHATGSALSESRYWSRVQCKQVSATLDCRVLLGQVNLAAGALRPRLALVSMAPGQSTRFQLPDTSGVSRLKKRWFAKPQPVGALSSQRGQPAWMLAAMANSRSRPLA